ncbi:MAG TPA: FtsX-like permease family protein, partial [Longimicrobiales bacterium]|nr:FtsX-like permease family protein [Longimicrobiales bacterium]
MTPRAPPWLDGLLRLYPRAWRERFGPGIREMLAESYAAAQARGRIAVALLWLNTLGHAIVIGIAERVPTMTPRAVLAQWRDDLRYGARLLRRSPVFTAGAVGSLSVAFALVAVTTAVVNAYLLRGFPYPDDDRLYRVQYATPGEPEPRGMSTLDWRELAHVIEHADNSAPTRLYMDAGADRREIMGLLAAPGSLDILGITAVAGRSLQADDFAPGAEPVALIGHGLWRDRFSGDPAVIGSVFDASRASGTGADERYRIIGILPENFRYARTYERGPLDFVAPLREPERAYMVRLRRDVPAASAERVVDDAVRRAATSLPPDWPGVRLQSVHDSYVDGVRPVLSALTIASAIVILITGINLAVLMLLRALRRQSEWAVRIALGAGRARLMGMQMAESAVLCGAALVVGVAAGALALRTLEPMIEERLGREAPGATMAMSLDLRVLVVVGVGALLMALLLAAVPLFAPWQHRLATTLRGAGRSATDGRTARRVRGALLATEVAASLALLTGCVLMVRTVMNLVRTELGYSTEHVVRARIALPPEGYADETSFLHFYDRLSQQLEAGNPYALSDGIPFYEYPLEPMELDGAPAPFAAGRRAVGPAWFDVLGMRLLEGRGFTAGDRLGNEPVAVVSASFAARVAAGGSALGLRIRAVEADVGWRTIVGVVNDIRQTHVDTHLDDVYVPFAQAPSRYAPLYARTAQPPHEWLRQVREAAVSIDPLVLVTGGGSSLAEQEDRLLAGPRFLMSLLTGFGLFAAVLTALGVYGVTAYSAQQRRRELAIRAAVGATRGELTMLFLHDTARVLIVGVAAGLLGAAGVARLLEHQLHGVRALDPPTLVIAAAAIAAVALCASWWPAV